MRRAVGAALALALLAALAGCAPAAPPAPRITVSVFQYRSDYAVRQAQIELVNHSKEDLEITSARFSSDWFTTTVASGSTPSQLLAGSTTDFAVKLPAGACSAAHPTPRPSVQVRYRALKGGATGELTATPALTFDSIDALHTQDCGRIAFETVARVTLAGSLRYQDDGTGRQIALLDLSIAPTGAPGTVTLDATEDTTLLANREGSYRTLGITVDAASAPRTVTLDYVPEGCLQHRVAEDKIGTLIPLHVDAGTYHDVVFSLPASPALKEEIMTWVGRYCGW